MKAGVLIGHMGNKGNEGSIIRSAEAFGINHIFRLGESPGIYKSAEGADSHVTFTEFENEDDFVKFAHANNYHIVCVENVNDAVSLSDIEKYPPNPIFITGNEKNGVSEKLLRNSSKTIKIEQGMGYVTCLNTSVAMAIVLRDFFEKHRRKMHDMWETGNHRRKNATV